jgi:hypothetical protein
MGEWVSRDLGQVDPDVSGGPEVPVLVGGRVARCEDRPGHHGPAQPRESSMSRDDDVDLGDVPEADAAEQQVPLDYDDLPEEGEKADDSALEHASEADVLEQRQSVTGDEDYPHDGSEEA